MKVLHDATFTAGLHYDKHFFYNYNIHICHSKFHVNMFVYLCSINYDQKHSTEFNTFKMKLFANIWRIIFCLYLVDRTCKYRVKKG